MSVLISAFAGTLSGMMLRRFRKPGGQARKMARLLALAAKTYYVFIAVDRFIFSRISQLSALQSSCGGTNRLADLSPLAKDVLSELSLLKPGQVSQLAKESS